MEPPSSWDAAADGTADDFVAEMREYASQFASVSERLSQLDTGPDRIPEWTDEDRKRFEKEAYADGERAGIIIGLIFGFFAGLVGSHLL